MDLNTQSSQALPQNLRLRLNSKELFQASDQILRHLCRQISRSRLLPLLPLAEDLANEKHIGRGIGHQCRFGLPPRQMPGQDLGALRVDGLSVCYRLGVLPVGRIKRAKNIPLGTHPQLQRLRAARLQLPQVKRARGHGMFDADGVVEIHDGVDGPQRGAVFEKPLVQRFVGLWEFLGGEIERCFQRVAVQSNSGVGLSVWIAGESAEGGSRRVLWGSQYRYGISFSFAWSRRESDGIGGGQQEWRQAGLPARTQ